MIIFHLRFCNVRQSRRHFAFTILLIFGSLRVGTETKPLTGECICEYTIEQTKRLLFAVFPSRSFHLDKKRYVLLKRSQPWSKTLNKHLSGIVDRCGVCAEKNHPCGRGVQIANLRNSGVECVCEFEIG